MKVNFKILFVLLIVCAKSQAEGIPRRHSNSNYKYLKLSAKVIERDSNCYHLQIELRNTGKKALKFWLIPSDYGFNFAFSAAGILICEKPFLRTANPSNTQVNCPDILVNLPTQEKYTIQTWCRIISREKFLKTKSNLRLVFIYNDGNLAYGSDSKQIISNDSVVYQW
ncbi:MAG: hypothetical protein RIS29_781 [Bacteroidota bacterium]|jgi:hypothetical protein